MIKQSVKFVLITGNEHERVNSGSPVEQIEIALCINLIIFSKINTI